METKMPLPSFLKLLTTKNIPTLKAMTVASKIYKEFNTPAMISQLTDLKLQAMGVDDKDLRKSTLAAFRGAGYAPSRKALSKKPESAVLHADTSTDANAGPSSSTVHQLTTPAKKRKRDDVNEFLPTSPDQAATYGSLEFDEVLDENVLMTKYTVVNRAPLMTAWAMIVAERIGFQREEALSIASVYTEMNAVSKGVSLGIFESSKNKGPEATKGGSQPYVEIMDRKALYQTQSGLWYALANNDPAQPSTAFSYISRAFRQTTAHIIGSLRLLANSFEPQELNEKGFGLYAAFRPDVAGWGRRGELRCDKILALRKEMSGDIKREVRSADVMGEEQRNVFIKIEKSEQTEMSLADVEPNHKKQRGLSLEEYEAALDQDTSFHDVEF